MTQNQDKQEDIRIDVGSKLTMTQNQDKQKDMCVDVGSKIPEEADMFTTVVGVETDDIKIPVARQGSTVSSVMSHLSQTIEEVKSAGPMLLMSLCMVSALEGADMALLPAVFYALQEDLGMQLTDLATMTLVQGVFGCLSAPFWGIVADRGLMQRKNIIIMGCVLQGIVTMLLAFVDQFYTMTSLRALNGILLASLRPVANGVIADVTAETNRGKVYGFVNFFTNAGLMAGGLIGTPMSTQIILGFQGWRVAFIGIGAASVAIGAFATLTLTEPPRQISAGPKEKGALRQELKKLLGYFRMPTFGALIFQGWFGGIPWAALGYSTLFYQVGGLTDTQAAAIAACSQASGAFGGMLGGVIGDRLAKYWPMHGRPLTAQISVMAGLPVAYLTFMVDPPTGEAAFFYYLGLVIFMGLTASWCGVAVNLPILTEIVEPDGRATILAWEAALESTFATIMGNAMVGFLAQSIFGYHLDKDKARESAADPESRMALGKALTLTCFVPWIICWLAYSLLHWSYPKDVRRVREDRARARKLARAARKTREADPLDMASPKSDHPLTGSGDEEDADETTNVAAENGDQIIQGDSDDCARVHEATPELEVGDKSAGDESANVVSI